MKQNIVGEKIRSVMTARDISMAELSDRTGLSDTQINFILESEVVPSLAPLIKIARGLGVRLGTFLDDSEQMGPVVHRSTESQMPASFSSQLSNANSHLDFFALAGNKAGRHMEPFIIDIKPALTQEPVLSSHEGEEFIYVLSGKIKVNYGREEQILSQGDSIYYDSIVEHLVSAADDQAAKILAVVYTPL